jgi:formylglycine-generating enzyme required for sulfatase activity
MAGNVSEWTASHGCDYPISGLMPATCENAGQNYYLSHRGGGFQSSATAITTFARNLDPIDTAYPPIGFRCAKSL